MKTVKNLSRRDVLKGTTALGLTVDRQFSFPFPRAVGKVFTYNEFVTIARKG